jgi:SAM-dependent methyltransferase
MSRPRSVVHGRDRDVIPLLLDLHARPSPRILDATYNRGVMWQGLDYVVTSMDIDPQFGTDVVGDFRSMPFLSGSFDVIVFDPPHLPAAAASEHSSGMWRTRYGITADGDYRQGDNVSPAFAAFLVEAKRVLRPDGIVLAKIADLVHNHRYQWQHVDFVNAAMAVGLTPCDAVIKVDPAGANLSSSKWVNVRHLRREHTYWIVVRKGRCERAAAMQKAA